MRRSLVLGFALAVAAVGLALLLRTAADPLLGDRTPFIFLFPAVVVTGWYAGRAPALAAVGLGALGTYAMFPFAPELGAHSLTTYGAGLVVFALVSLAMIELTMAMRRAEVRSQRAVERLDLALGTGNMGVFEWDVKKNEVWWSESLEPVHGLPRGAFGRTFEAFRQLVHADDRDNLDAAFDKAVRCGGEFEIEFRFIRPDGAVRWMRASGRVFPDELGKPARVVGTSRDITEHREAAGALREVEGRFEALLSHAPLVVFAKDRDGRYLIVNGLCAHLLGMTEAEILGKSDAELCHPALAALTSTGDAEVLETGEPKQFEQTVELRGETLTFLTIKFPLCDETGDPIGVCAIANDITARKEAEAALKDADRRKDEFLAILAHELRNPLAPVRLALEMLRTNDGDKAADARALDVMGRQLAHLVRLIDDLLDVSRITRGKLELRRARVSLAEVLRTALETSRPQIDAAKHTLHVSIPDEPIELQADLTRLAQVVSNLLNNAAKYTPRGGAITLDVLREGSTVEIRVADNGIGLAPEHVGKVFEMFTQVGPLTTRGHGGLGIGLALARALVDMHGGRIEAASDGPDLGSRFTVHLPVAEPLEALARAPEVDLPSTTRLRVLVADDNRDAIDTLALFLERSGHTVCTANDGAEAVAAAATFLPDVCVLDIGMPLMDGYEVARTLRANGSRQVLIALTGWGQAEDHRKSREAGFDYHLIKPVQPSTLIKLLATASRAA